MGPVWLFCWVQVVDMNRALDLFFFLIFFRIFLLIFKIWNLKFVKIFYGFDFGFILLKSQFLCCLHFLLENLVLINNLQKVIFLLIFQNLLKIVFFWIWIFTKDTFLVVLMNFNSVLNQKFLVGRILFFTVKLILKASGSLDSTNIFFHKIIFIWRNLGNFDKWFGYDTGALKNADEDSEPFNLIIIGHQSHPFMVVSEYLKNNPHLPVEKLVAVKIQSFKILKT